MTIVVLKNSKPAFQELWKVYPKHAKVKAARGAWIKLDPSRELLAEMLAAIEIQTRPGGILAVREDSGDQYIPHCASWLSGERWTETECACAVGETYVSREFSLAEALELNLYPEGSVG